MSGLGLQTSKPPHRSNRCGAGRWVASWEYHISAPAPGTPLVCQSRTPTSRVVFASGRPTPTDSDFSGLGVTFTASFAQCLLFAQRAHPGSSVGGHSYSNREFRALGYTGVVTSGATFTYALFSDKTVWNYHYHCDGAYPQPQWDCACSAYNYHSTI